uniref:Heat shock protein DnaJ n=1 Tax=Solanum tuberosum TaxID=4113 RepID=M1DBF6_SOLTU
MPRFYAVIRKILSPAFKLCITRLESEPLSEDEIKGLSEEFPTFCAWSRLGNSEDIEYLPMFSDLACSINGNNYNAIKIFPLEGETWPLSKDWDMNWCPHLGSKKNFNYEFIELLSNYVDSIGVHVVYLVKAKGFTCLFRQAGYPFLVPTKNMFRFSHRIPFMKMTRMETDDVPKGSFELDPSSLPTDQVDISASSIDQRLTTYHGLYKFCRTLCCLST